MDLNTVPSELSTHTILPSPDVKLDDDPVGASQSSSNLGRSLIEDDDAANGGALHQQRRSRTQERSGAKRPRRSDAEIDGFLYARERDAPGQSCRYIPSGDHRCEEYRRSTFSCFPPNAPVLAVHLAKVGFYFTGFKDRVKCFSCGLAVEGWQLDDDEFDVRWHRDDCTMMRNDELNNIPSDSGFASLVARMRRQTPSGRRSVPGRQFNVYDDWGGIEGIEDTNENLSVMTNRLENCTIGNPSYVPKLNLAQIYNSEHERMIRNLDMRKESDRRKTFKKWPSYPAPFLPCELAQFGFFYLGNLDRTQCFSCSGVLRNWTTIDSVQEEHKKHFSHCRMVNGKYAGNVEMTNQERQEANEIFRREMSKLLPGSNANIVEPPDPSPQEQRNLALYFPCENAVNANMANEDDRFATFNDNWPRTRIRADPTQIAKAGFYYLGESDKCKCFYCNGGLQNWEENDEPWTEHGKWFPNCEFMLRRKGVEFVRGLCEAHPNLPRPNIRNPVSYDIPQSQENGAPGTSEAPTPRLDMDQVKGMGFSEQQITRVMQRKEEKCGRPHANTQELIEDLIGNAEEEEEQSPSRCAPATENPTTLFYGQPQVALAQKRNINEVEVIANGGGSKKNRPNSPPNYNNIQPTEEEMELAENVLRIEESDRCKICHKKKADVVFNPCGHLAACSECATTARRCTLCKEKIQECIKVYRA